MLSSDSAPPAPISVDVPAGWRQTDDEGGFTVRPGGASGPLAPSVRLELRRTDAALDLLDLPRLQADELADGLLDARVLDQGFASLGEHDAHRVLLAHRVDGHDVTVEQWATPRGRRLIVATVSAPTLDHAELAPELDDLIDSFELHA